MPSLSTHHLVFPNGLHIGSHSGNLEESGLSLPADTLFAALVDTWRRTGGDPQAFVAPFLAGKPPFLLTSAFPHAGGVRFYPMPVDTTRLLSAEVLRTRHKLLRRVRYLSEGLLRRAAAGHPLDNLLFPDEQHAEPATGVALQEGQFWLTLDETNQLPASMQRDRGHRHALYSLPVIAHSRVPRVTVDRVGAASTIYHVGRTSFAAACGLWFGVQWQDPMARIGTDGPTYSETLPLLLAVLGDGGIGGERTAGYGAFQVVATDSVELPNTTADQPAYLLSRYHPHTEQEVAGLRHPQAAYALVKVGGWLRSYDRPAQRRRRVTLVSEGSIIPLQHSVQLETTGDFTAGDIVDVRPRYPQEEDPFPHPVYRYGLALGVGWQEARNGEAAQN